MSLIQLDHLTRSYGRRRGIERVSLSVPEGTLFGFLGPNGAGKTTTIRVMLGFLHPTNGTARIFGLDCWRQTKVIKRDTGYLPGDLRLPPWMNGTNALSIFGAVRGRYLSASGRELAERFDLDLRVKVRDMSQGMRQKLGLILALAHSPRLLVLDEPTSSLDPLVQQALHDLLRQLAAAGQTVFFSSHSLGEVEQLCDRIAIAVLGLSDAQVHEIAAVREAMENDEAVRAARGVSKDDPQREQARATMEAATARLREKVAAILTPEQRTLIDKINGLHAAAVEETAVLYGPRFGSVKNDEAARLRLHEEIRNATDEVFRRNLERDLTAEQKAAMAHAAEEERGKDSVPKKSAK